MKKKKAPTASPSTRGKNAARSQETSFGTQSIYRFQNESKYVSINSTGDFIAIPRKPGGIALPKVLKTDLAAYHYVRGKRLGRGGFGLVFEAFPKPRYPRQEQIVRLNGEEPDPVCIKILGDQESWHREAYFSYVTRKDPRFVRIIETFPIALQRKGEPYTLFVMVMELMKGGDLVHYLKGSGPWSEKRALQEVKGLLGSLQKLHAHGIMHLDITPKNILVDDEGRLKFTDMGLAKQNLWTRKARDKVFNQWFASAGRRADLIADPKSDVEPMGQILMMLLAGDASKRLSLDTLEKRGVSCSQKTKDLIRGACAPRERRFADAIEMLEAMSPDAEKKATPLHSLSGMTVVFTGDLRGLKRDAAKVRVAQAGGTVANRVTRATNVLVTGKVSRHYRRGNRGKKIAQAIKLNRSGAGIHFISEQQFLHLASGKAIRE